MHWDGVRARADEEGERAEVPAPRVAAARYFPDCALPAVAVLA